MLDPVMSGIYDGQPLRHRIDAAVMVNVSGDQHLCTGRDRIPDRTLS